MSFEVCSKSHIHETLLAEEAIRARVEKLSLSMILHLLCIADTSVLLEQVADLAVKAFATPEARNSTFEVVNTRSINWWKYLVASPINKALDQAYDAAEKFVLDVWLGY